MKIKIVVEKENKFCEIPLTKSELSDIMDMAFYLSDSEFKKDMNINKIKPFEVGWKFNHILNDIIYDGRTYEFKRVKGRYKTILRKERHYFKKPKWMSKR